MRSITSALSGASGIVISLPASFASSIARSWSR